MNEQQERAIAQGLRAGDPEAWRTFYDTFCERVWRTAARRIGANSADVADVVQETFLAAARSAGQFDPERGPLWAWLTGILRNQVALQFRKKQRHERIRAQHGSQAFVDLRDHLLVGVGLPGAQDITQECFAKRCVRFIVALAGAEAHAFHRPRDRLGLLADDRARQHD